MKIASTTGIWVQSSAKFPLTDGENGTRFEPGEPTKAEETAWLKGQSDVLKPIDDPMAPPPEVKPLPKK